VLHAHVGVLGCCMLMLGCWGVACSCWGVLHAHVGVLHAHVGDNRKICTRLIGPRAEKFVVPSANCVAV